MDATASKPICTGTSRQNKPTRQHPTHNAWKFLTPPIDPQGPAAQMVLSFIRAHMAASPGTSIARQAIALTHVMLGQEPAALEKVHVCVLVYDGVGRRKDAVLRTLKTLSSGGDSLGTLDLAAWIARFEQTLECVSVARLLVDIQAMPHPLTHMWAARQARAPGEMFAAANIQGQTVVQFLGQLALCVDVAEPFVDAGLRAYRIAAGHLSGQDPLLPILPPAPGSGSKSATLLLQHQTAAVRLLRDACTHAEASSSAAGGVSSTAESSTAESSNAQPSTAEPWGNASSSTDLANHVQKLAEYATKAAGDIATLEAKIKCYEDERCAAAGGTATRALKRKLAISMSAGGKAALSADPLLIAHRDRVAQIVELLEPLKQLLPKSKPQPPVQLLYLMAAPLHAGDQFDVTISGGCFLYHTAIFHGHVSAGAIASVVLRGLDFEDMCRGDTGDTGAEAFRKATRSMHVPVLVYLASIHNAWIAEYALGKRSQNLTSSSACHLQCTRQHLETLAQSALDPSAEIVTLVFEVTTDLRNVHLCALSPNDDVVQKIAEALDEEDLKADSFADLNRDASGLIRCSKKDLVPLETFSNMLIPFLERVCQTGKWSHVFLVGCNSVGIVANLIGKLSEAAKKTLMLLATTSVWPSGISPLLWCCYFTPDLTTDLSEYRVQTRMLLDEWTVHHKRQRIVDDSMEEVMKKVRTLADLVVLDRADAIAAPNAGCLPAMSPL